MHVSLYTRLIILISFVLIYLHYMHYILSLRTVTLNMQTFNKHFYNSSNIESPTSTVNLRNDVSTQILYEQQQQQAYEMKKGVNTDIIANKKYIATLEAFKLLSTYSSSPSSRPTYQLLSSSSSPSTHLSTSNTVKSEAIVPVNKISTSQTDETTSSSKIKHIITQQINPKINVTSNISNNSYNKSKDDDDDFINDDDDDDDDDTAVSTTAVTNVDPSSSVSKIEEDDDDAIDDDDDDTKLLKTDQAASSINIISNKNNQNQQNNSNNNSNTTNKSTTLTSASTSSAAVAVNHWNIEKFPNAKFSKLKETITQHAKPHEMINPDTMHHMTVDHPHHSPRDGTFIEYDYFKVLELRAADSDSDNINNKNMTKNKVEGDDGYADIGDDGEDDDDSSVLTKLDDDTTNSNSTSTATSKNQLHTTGNNNNNNNNTIEEAQVLKLLSCIDQHDCIIPSLQLQIKMNIYLCKRPKDGGGVRFFFLIKQGLLLHPNVNLIRDLNNISASSGYSTNNKTNTNIHSNSSSYNNQLSSQNNIDYFLYLPGSSTSWEQSECNSDNSGSSSDSSSDSDHNSTGASLTSTNTNTNTNNNTRTTTTYLYNTTQKLIILEEFDGTSPLYSPYNSYTKMKQMYGKSLRFYNMYFKRSFVDRRDGKFKGYPLINKPPSKSDTNTANTATLKNAKSTTTTNNNNSSAIDTNSDILKSSSALITAAATEKDIYPFTYPIAEDYIPASYNVHTHREISILCTLRGSKNSSSPMSTRIRTQEWVTEYTIQRNLTHTSITEPLNMATRTALNKAYFEHMHNAKIIVTVNPADWEGDFRLWESLASGALVFVDPLFVPHPYPLLDGVHAVYFSNHNKTELWSKLDYFLTHPLVMQQVARNGYLYAMKHHRAINLIDYILCSAHLKRVITGNNNAEHNNISKISLPQYSYTAQYLNYEAKRQEQNMILHQLPGMYQPHTSIY